MRFCKSVTDAASPAAETAALYGLEHTHLGRIGAAENQADVGMRDEMTWPVHDESVAGLADMDGRDHVPDQLEVDLGDRGAALARGPATAIVI